MATFFGFLRFKILQKGDLIVHTGSKNISTPAISVIVPVYNCRDYLASCIDSILGQTFRHFELILIDDGSHDGSETLCDTYAHLDPRVNVIHKANGGVSAARNSGIDIAKGKYLTFVDSDDTLDSTFLEYAFETAETHGVDLFISGLFMESYRSGELFQTVTYGIDAPAKFNPRTLLEALTIHYPLICICGPCCKLYRAALVKQKQLRFPLSLNRGEDTYFNIAVLEHVNTIYFSDQNFYHYRRSRSDSLYSTFHRDIYEIHRLIFGKMRVCMQKCQCSPAAMDRFENLYFSMLLGSIGEYYHFQAQTTPRERKAFIQKVAADPCLQRYSLHTMQGFKNKTMLLLLKWKWFLPLMALYRMKSRIQASL